MNRLYPSFAATCLANVLAGSESMAAPSLFFYALNSGYEYDAGHVSLVDVPVVNRIAKSKLLAGTLQSDGSLEVAPVADAFSRATLTDVSSVILVAEWDTDSLLVVYMDSWVNTGVPFTAPTTVDMAFQDDFVFRLGSVGRIV